MWLLVLFEDQVSDCGFEVPVDDRNCSQIEGGMRTHQRPDPASDSEDRPEYETRNSRLLGASQPLPKVVERRKHRSRYEHGHGPGGRAPSEQLAESLEHIPTEYGLFSEARHDNHGQHGCRERSPIPGQIMVSLIDWIGPEQRHHKRLHEKFEQDSESNANDQAS